MKKKQREKETAAAKTKQNKLNVKMKKKGNSQNESEYHFLPVIKASEKFRCIYICYRLAKFHLFLKQMKNKVFQ